MIAVPKKNLKISFYVDLKTSNKYVCEVYSYLQLIKPWDTYPEKTKLTTNSEYWEIPLSFYHANPRSYEHSLPLVIWNLNLLNFFQMHKCRTLIGLDNVLNLYDAVFILKHNVRLVPALKQFQEVGVAFNKDNVSLLNIKYISWS